MLGFYLIFLFIVIHILNAIWFLGILKHLLRNLGVIKNQHKRREEPEREEQPLMRGDADEDQAAGDN